MQKAVPAPGENEIPGQEGCQDPERPAWHMARVREPRPVAALRWCIVVYWIERITVSRYARVFLPVTANLLFSLTFSDGVPTSGT